MSALRIRVLVNSLPKSGTHLLAQAVELLGFREHFADTGPEDTTRSTPLFLNYREVRDALAAASEAPAPAGVEAITVGSLTPCPVPVPSVRRWLDAVPAGRYLLGHVLWTPALPPLLAELDYRHVFIIRDPRAVAMSLLAFILDSGKMPRRHFLEADLKAMPPDQRLDFILAGGHAPEAGVEVLGFAEVYRTALNWRKAPGCLLLRYEDLVGERGGGDPERQRAAFERLAAHLGVPMEDGLPARVYNPEARTFRTGRIGGWREALAPAERARLEAACAPLCAAAGYGDDAA